MSGNIRWCLQLNFFMNPENDSARMASLRLARAWHHCGSRIKLKVILGSSESPYDNKIKYEHVITQQTYPKHTPPPFLLAGTVRVHDKAHRICWPFGQNVGDVIQDEVVARS